MTGTIDHVAPGADRAALTTPISYLLGDTLCRACRFNLVGQPVEREPERGIPLVECPHCGAMAAAQEYPPAGPWPARWMTFIAALWLSTIISFVVMASVTIVGMGIGFTVEATDGLKYQLDWMSTNWKEEQVSAGVAQAPVTDRSFDPPGEFEQFWEARLFTAHLDEIGGWSQVVEWHEYAANIIPAIGAFLAGGLISLMLLHRTRRALWLGSLPLAGVCALALVITWIVAVSVPIDSELAVVRLFTLPLLVVTGVAIWLCVWAGLLLGRPIARGIVRALLPPGERGPLVILWPPAKRDALRRSGARP